MLSTQSNVFDKRLQMRFLACLRDVKEITVWEHPHSHLPTRRYTSQHVSQCGSTHIATFQLAVIHHSNTTPLSPILLSLQTPVSAHSSRNKHRFPSQYWLSTFVLIATPTTLANRPMGGQMKQKKPYKKAMVSARESFIGIQQEGTQQDSIKKAATISRRASTFHTHRDGQPVRNRRSNWVVDSKGSRIVGDGPERSKASLDTYHHDIERKPVIAVPGACRSIVRHRSSVPRAPYQSISPSTAADQISVFQLNTHQVQTTNRARQLLAQRITQPRVTIVWQTKINRTICALLRLSFHNPAVCHNVFLWDLVHYKPPSPEDFSVFFRISLMLTWNAGEK